MASVLKIQQAGVTIADFMVSPYHLLEFTANGPTLREETLASSLEHGTEILFTRYDNVKDTIVAMITGATAQDIQNTLADLEQAIEEARTRLNSFGDIVSLSYKPDGVTDTYTCALYQISMMSQDNPALEWTHKAQLLGATSGVKYQIIVFEITRAYAWDGPTTEIPLTNGNGSNITGGIDVYNHDDGTAGHDNYVEIAAAAVPGGVPSPAIIYMENLNNEANRIRNVHVSKNVGGTPNTFDHFLEAEAATLNTYGTVTNDADCSGTPTAQRVAYSGIPASETWMCRWTLSSADLVNCGSRWFKVIGRITAISAGTRIRFKVLFAQLTTLYETEWVVPNVAVVDLGVVKLPPYKSTIAPYTLDLYMYAMKPGGAGSFSLDYIELAPCEEPDGHLLFESQGYDLAWPWTLAYHGIADDVYIFSSGNEQVSNYVAYGSGPLTITPGKLQRFYFLWDRSAGVSGTIDWKLSVSVFYKPRRLKI